MREDQAFSPARPLPNDQEIDIQGPGGPSARLRATSFRVLERLGTTQKPRRGGVNPHGEDGVQKRALPLVGIAGVSFRLVHGRRGLNPNFLGPNEAVHGCLKVVSTRSDVGSQSEIRDGHGGTCMV